MANSRLMMVFVAIVAMVSPLAVVSNAQAASTSLTLHAPSSAQTMRGFNLWGYVYPARAGRTVLVHRLSGRSWVLVGRTTTSSIGRYSVVAKLPGMGRFTFRAVTGSWHGAAGAVSVRRQVSARARVASYRLDYQTGNFSQWTERHLHRAAQETIVSRPARAGYPRTARFTVAPGDYTNGGTSAERSEVMASVAKTGNPREGQTQWFAWSSFFPTGTHVSPGGWLLFTQWHQSGNSGSPNIAFELSKTTPVRVIARVRGQNASSPWTTEKSLGALTTNKWVDFTVGIKWSANPRVGRFIVRINGRVVANTAAATLYSGMSAYMKQGIYRAKSNQRQTIYHTGTRRGPTLASVAR